MTDAEYLFFNAVRGALNYDEPRSTEAVIRALRPKIPFLGDEALGEILKLVSAYIDEGIQGGFDAHFIPEWSDVRAWLTEEKQIRADIRKKVGNDEGKRRESADEAET